MTETFSNNIIVRDDVVDVRRCLCRHEVALSASSVFLHLQPRHISLRKHPAVNRIHLPIALNTTELKCRCPHL